MGTTTEKKRPTEPTEEVAAKKCTDHNWNEWKVQVKFARILSYYNNFNRDMSVEFNVGHVHSGKVLWSVFFLLYYFIYALFLPSYSIFINLLLAAGKKIPPRAPESIASKTPVACTTTDNSDSKTDWSVTSLKH